MLTIFSLKNYGPYQEETVFDLRAVPSYKEHEYNLERVTKDEGVLKVAVIYGANASGKSQFVDACFVFRAMVQGTFRTVSPSGEGDDNAVRLEGEGPLAKWYNPFLLSDEEKDTEFEATFEAKEGTYRYGFSFNAEAITAEWLYFVNRKTNRQSTILERAVGEGISLGASVRGECNKYVPNIPKDVLALSFFDSLVLKTEVFKNAASEVYAILPIPNLSVDKETRLFLDSYFDHEYSDETKGALIDFLSEVDLGIVDFTVERSKSGVAVWTHRKGRDGRTYRLPLELESDGTLKMIALFSLLDNAITKGLGLIIDELDAELHPLLVRHIVSLFHKEESHGQLVFTAHDLSLLDRRYLRRDQVWFTSKDECGAAKLTCLSDYRVRNDSSFGDAYLAGVFGAIPNIVNRG